MKQMWGCIILAISVQAQALNFQFQNTHFDHGTSGWVVSGDANYDAGVVTLWPSDAGEGFLSQDIRISAQFPILEFQFRIENPQQVPEWESFFELRIQTQAGTRSSRFLSTQSSDWATQRWNLSEWAGQVVRIQFVGFHANPSNSAPKLKLDTVQMRAR